MSDRTELLGLIPARRGSKGLPGKNIRTFAGRPLLEWAIEVALASSKIDRVIVSTDDDNTASIARAAGAEVPFLRPSEISRDDSPTVLAVRHCLEWLAATGEMPNYVAVLEPTSPGRRAFHIDEAIQILRERKVDSVASVSGVPHHYVPEKVLLMDKDGHLSGLQGSHPDHMIHLRQLASRYFAFDGIFFGCRAELPLADEPTLWGENVVGYEVEPKYVMDIDTQDDWDLAEVKFKWIQRGG